MRDLVKIQDDYQHLVEQVDATFVEKVTASKLILIEGYWEVGKLIKEFGGNTTSLLQDLAVDTGRSERMLWYAYEIYNTYPDLNTLPEGKNISLNKLITKYLTKPKEEEHTEEYTTCPTCLGKGKIKYEIPQRNNN